jgi:hypothetical protein
MAGPITRKDRLTAHLQRIEDLLAGEVDGSKFAALSREYRIVMDELERFAPPSTESKADELAKRRAKRGATAPDSSRARRRAQSGGG